MQTVKISEDLNKKIREKTKKLKTEETQRKIDAKKTIKKAMERLDAVNTLCLSEPLRSLLDAGERILIKYSVSHGLYYALYLASMRDGAGVYRRDALAAKHCRLTANDIEKDIERAYAVLAELTEKSILESIEDVL